MAIAFSPKVFNSSTQKRMSPECRLIWTIPKVENLAGKHGADRIKDLGQLGDPQKVNRTHGLIL
ncbi:MAG: hypothetical protein M1G31_06495 [Pseudanabaena sp. Salubria-1]|nr:hypothetical protein [Pseudanabaena sp. Salubria-1]